MSKPPKKRGGKRLGAGRKPTGKNTRTHSVSMPETLWKTVDANRGSDPRGLYIARVMGLVK